MPKAFQKCANFFNNKAKQEFRTPHALRAKVFNGAGRVVKVLRARSVWSAEVLFRFVTQEV